MKKEELAALQNKKLRSIVRHAYYNVPFYHDAFAQRNVDPDRIRGTEQLRLLPLLTRQLIEENYPDRMLASGRSLGGTLIRHTSGTTGRPLEIVWDNEYCDRTAAKLMVQAQSRGVSILDRAVEVEYWGPEEGGPGPNSGRGRLTERAQRLRKILVGPITTPALFTLRSRKMGFHRSIIEIEKELLRFRPVAINCRPSYLRRLGHHLEGEGRRLQIRKIVAVGEYLSSSVRSELERLFDSEVFNALGSQELGPLGSECREHSGIHLHSDYFAFEFLKDGEQASAGEAADLVVTSLYNKKMPLIRYRLGDVVVPESDEICACGLHLPRLREIRGRPDDGLQLPGGVQIPVGPVVDRVEGLGFRDYQIVQTSERSVLIRLVQEQSSGERIESLISYVRSLFGVDAKVKLEEWRVDDIPPKYRPVLRQFPAS